MKARYNHFGIEANIEVEFVDDGLVFDHLLS